MRVVACCLLILGALASAGNEPARAAARCAPAVDSNGKPVKSKPVSFAPRPGHRHVYGQPIQSPIFSKPGHHPPRKPPPQQQEP